MFSANSTLRGVFVRIKWKVGNENTDGRFHAFHQTMGFQCHCFADSLSPSFFFFHLLLKVLLLMGAV